MIPRDDIGFVWCSMMTFFCLNVLSLCADVVISVRATEIKLGKHLR